MKVQFFNPFCSASPEIIGFKVYRQTDRQTEKFFDTIYGGMHIFLSVKFPTFLLASLAVGKKLHNVEGNYSLTLNLSYVGSTCSTRSRGWELLCYTFDLIH